MVGGFEGWDDGCKLGTMEGDADGAAVGVAEGLAVHESPMAPSISSLMI